MQSIILSDVDTIHSCKCYIYICKCYKLPWTTRMKKNWGIDFKVLLSFRPLVRHNVDVKVCYVATFSVIVFPSPLLRIHSFSENPKSSSTEHKNFLANWESFSWILTFFLRTYFKTCMRASARCTTVSHSLTFSLSLSLSLSPSPHPLFSSQPWLL